MTTIELISKLIEDVEKNGDREVRISLRSGTMPVAEVHGSHSIVFLRTQVPT